MKGDSLSLLDLYQDIEYGTISCHLKEVMKEKNITIYRLSFASNIKYEVIKRYYNNNISKYDACVLAKFCHYLDCELSSLLKYEK